MNDVPERRPRTPATLETGSIFPLILFFFFLSGAAGLIYEVVWTRYLTLAFGVTAEAVGAVLAAYMAGLALGSYLLGRRSTNFRNLLRAYARLELGVGVFALLTPAIYQKLEAVNVLLFRGLGEGGAAFGILRFLVFFAVMLIPTTLMGGTLPILSRLVVARRDRVGSGVGTLYSVNTFGAVLGTFSAGYFLIPRFGLSSAVYLAAVVNVSVGIWCVLLSRRPALSPSGEGAADSPEPERAVDVGAPRHLQIGVMLGLGISGLVALLFEVVWTRMLQLVLGTSAYAFACMLTTFLFGIALGSLLASKFVDRAKDPARLFAFIQLGVGFCALAIIPLFGELPFLFLRLFAATGREWWQTSMVEFALAFLVMLVPTVLFGASFPVAARVVSGRVRFIGRTVGNIYALNTLGAIAGSLLSAFVLIPRIGTQRSEFLGAGLSIALGVVLLLMNVRVRVWQRMASAAVAAAVFISCVLYLPGWDMKILLWGVWHKAAGFMPVGRQSASLLEIGDQLRQGRLVYYDEGTGLTVAVFEEHGGLRSFLVDGRVEASTLKMDMRLQRLLGHLPVLLHPDPKRVINIGLGAGVTFGAVMQHPIEQGLCVELSRSVLGAARLFADVNHNVLEEPRVRLIVQDGRTYLAATTDGFDCITADPCHPHTRGMGNIYTVEYFEAARERLNPGGVMAQWLPLYNLSDRDFKMIVRTFGEVFPHVSFWFTDVDIVMIGTEEPMQVDYRVLSERMKDEPVRESLAEIDFHTPDDILARFIMDERSLDEYCGNVATNTEDHPILEYSAPKAVFARTLESNLAEALKFRRFESLPVTHLSDDPGEASDVRQRLGVRFEAMGHSMEGQVRMAEGRYQDAVTCLGKSLELYPDDMTVREHVARCYVLMSRRFFQMGDIEKVRELCEAAVDVYPREVAARVNLGNYYLQRDQFEKALDLYRGALLHIEGTGIGGVHLQVAETLVRLGRLEEAIPEFRLALEEEPDVAWVRNNFGSILVRLGNWLEAIRQFNEAIRIDPEHADAYVNLGACLLNQGKVEEAVKHFSAAIRIDPEHVQAHANLGITLYRQGRVDEARRELETAVRLAPGSAQLRAMLEQMGSPGTP